MSEVLVTLSKWLVTVVGAMIVSGSISVAEGQPGETNATERLELEIYRRSYPELQARLNALEAQNLAATGYDKYLANFYEQRRLLNEHILRVFRWQLLASNIVLALVVILALSGILLAAYQLLVAARIALSLRAGNVSSPISVSDVSKIEISGQRISLQTSAVGVLVLGISAALLIFFLREVYQVNAVDLDRVNTSSSTATSR